MISDESRTPFEFKFSLIEGIRLGRAQTLKSLYFARPLLPGGGHGRHPLAWERMSDPDQERVSDPVRVQTPFVDFGRVQKPLFHRSAAILAQATVQFWPIPSEFPPLPSR